MFAVTNIDDMLVLAVFRSGGRQRATAVRVVVSQYLGYGAILLASVVGALGAGLSESVIPYPGLLPLGLRAAWQASGPAMRRTTRSSVIEVWGSCRSPP